MAKTVECKCATEDNNNLRLLSLEEHGISEKAFFEANDFRKYEMLEKNGLYPEEYADYFENYPVLDGNYVSLKKMEQQGLSYEKFLQSDTEEKILSLLTRDLCPEDYMDYLPALWKYAGYIDDILALKEIGLDYSCFMALSEDDKMYALLGKGVHPETFSYLFSCYEKRVIRADEMMRLVENKKDLWHFLSLSDEEKIYFLLEAGFHPEEFEDLFQDYSHRSELAEALYLLNENGISEQEFRQLADMEKMFLLIEKSINPSDVELFFRDMEEISQCYETYASLYAKKIDIRAFYHANAMEKSAMLAKKKLPKEDYLSIF
ncbi:MAG: hypothetical protein ACI4DU_02355 [Lachnospiraceae bacterium]